ncbi:MAG: oligosaccharide flippase family protein [Desmonostoc vinosum HA7617-LM4]|jgi:O-antigen/teichoic acid export membrane protein|nr:oligosaccharide flippase family protein [Desmonostoc vinosum HA7617-LM4]
MTQVNSTKIFKASLWMTVSFAVGKIAQLISQVILARLLSPQDFGIWAMVLILSNFSLLFRDVAIAQVLVQRGLDDKKIVNTVYSLGINISIGLFFIQAIAGIPLSYFFSEPLVFPLTACSSAIFLIGAGAGSHTAVLQRQMKFRELAICDGVATFARVASATLCAIGGMGVWSFAAGEVAMGLVDSLLKRSLSKYSFTYIFRLDPLAVSEVRKFIAGVVSSRFAVQLNTNGDNLIIGRLLGSKALGYYNLAYQLAMTPVYALSQVNRVIFSVLSQQDLEGKKAFLCRALELYAVLSAPIYGVAVVIAPWLIPLLYGSDWVEAVRLFQIVLIFAYARGFMSILGTSLLALDKSLTVATIDWALVPVSVSSYFLGAYLGGTQGVAIAVVLVMGIGATVWYWLATCHAANWQIKVLIRPILLPTITISIALILVYALPLPEYLIYTQSVILIFIYVTSLTVFSKGRIPKMLVDISQLALKHNRAKIS